MIFQTISAMVSEYIKIIRAIQGNISCSFLLQFLHTLPILYRYMFIIIASEHEHRPYIFRSTNSQLKMCIEIIKMSEPPSNGHHQPSLSSTHFFFIRLCSGALI